MAKVIELGFCKPGHPDFQSGFVMSFRPPLTQSTQALPDDTDGEASRLARAKVRQEYIERTAGMYYPLDWKST